MSSDENDARTKARIVNHMNKDHGASLSRYLEYYSRLPQEATQGATIEDVTFSYMILRTAASTRHLVPLDPPLRDWSEARPRLIKMDQDALEGLGRSDIVLDRYIAPRGFHAVVFVACVLTYAAFVRRAHFEPGSWLHDALLYDYPGFARFCRTIQPFLFPAMAAQHLSEAIWFARTRLHKYNVERFTRLWWVWMISIFIEGVGAMIRVDDMAEDRRSAKEKQKH